MIEAARAAEVIRAHWQPIFDGTAMDATQLQVANALTRRFREGACWTFSRDGCIIQGAQDSASGPNGIPSIVYKVSFDYSVFILFDEFRLFIDHEFLSADFHTQGPCIYYEG